MRGLTARQGQRCEDAKNKRCRCRCGGRFHGSKRGDVTTFVVADVHHAEPPKVKR